MRVPRLIFLISPALAALGLVVGLSHTALARQKGERRDRVVFDRALPPMDGQHLTMKVVDVRMAPGETSPPHKHGCAVVVYVVQGTVRMQVRGGPEGVFKQGETFHERPTDIHQVSANASATDSARITATFVCDHDGPLSTPVTGAP